MLSWLRFVKAILTMTTSPCYGTWAVLLRQTSDDGVDHYIPALPYDGSLPGYHYRGHVDAIAYALLGYFRSDRVLYFQAAPEAEGAALPELAPDDIPEYATVDVLLDGKRRLTPMPTRDEDGLVTVDGRDMRAFFADRPVYARYSEYGDCIVLHNLDDAEGSCLARERLELDRVLAKLSPEDIRVLQRKGFRYER